MIFRNTSPLPIGELAREPDINRLQSGAGTEIVYSREISPAGRRHILQYLAWNGQKSSPIPINHQGIEDAFVGKASVVLYFYRGKWRELTGAD